MQYRLSKEIPTISNNRDYSIIKITSPGILLVEKHGYRRFITNKRVDFGISKS